jgi:hypothetical protein
MGSIFAPDNDNTASVTAYFLTAIALDRALT